MMMMITMEADSQSGAKTKQMRQIIEKYVVITM